MFISNQFIFQIFHVVLRMYTSEKKKAKEKYDERFDELSCHWIHVDHTKMKSISCHLDRYCWNFWKSLYFFLFRCIRRVLTSIFLYFKWTLHVNVKFLRSFIIVIASECFCIYDSMTIISSVFFLRLDLRWLSNSIQQNRWLKSRRHICIFTCACLSSSTS